MTPPKEISQIAKEIVLLCRQMLNGSLGVIAAARQIKALAFQLHGDKFVHQMFQVFDAIDSETDHLPVGPERRHWAANALSEKDPEIQRYEQVWRDDALAAARNIVASYEETTS